MYLKRFYLLRALRAPCVRVLCACVCGSLVVCVCACLPACVQACACLRLRPSVRACACACVCEQQPDGNRG